MKAGGAFTNFTKKELDGSLVPLLPHNATFSFQIVVLKSEFMSFPCCLFDLAFLLTTIASAKL